MAQPQPTEVRLIERARLGDRGAQQDLWQAHRRWVAAVVLAHRPHRVEVEDLMQEVAVKLISKITTLRDPAAFRPWLRQIVINVCRGSARRLRPSLSLADERATERDAGEPGWAPCPVSAEPGAEQVTARRHASRRLLEQALTLPPEYREPLLLRCLRSMSYREIGTLLDLPVTTVETRLARARRMLREELGEQLIEESA